MPQLKSVMGK